MNQLAIIIPAYKDVFLRQTLDSISAQSCKDFTVYIGDDNSPYHLCDIIEEYRAKINIVYRHFDSNLGGKDLVSQWERCIAMSNSEPYIWLFSDDDVMGSECVEKFLNLPKSVRDNYLIHFNLNIIDEFAGADVTSVRKYPETLSAKDYLDEKLHLNGKQGLISYVVEFIFPREVYNSTGRFQNYDLAWGADFLTWLKFAAALKGIYSIDSPNACVSWRKSNVNISPDQSRPTLLRKINSLIENAVYIQQFLQKNEYKQTFLYSKFVWGVVLRYKNVLNIQDKFAIYKNFVKSVGYRLFATLSLIRVLF